MNRSLLEACQLEAGISLLLLARVACERAFVGIGETLDDGQPPLGRIDMHEPPRLAQANRRRVGGDLDQRVDALARQRIARKRRTSRRHNTRSRNCARKAASNDVFMSSTHQWRGRTCRSPSRSARPLPARPPRGIATVDQRFVPGLQHAGVVESCPMTVSPADPAGRRREAGATIADVKPALGERGLDLQQPGH